MFLPQMRLDDIQESSKLRKDDSFIFPVGVLVNLLQKFKEFPDLRAGFELWVSFVVIPVILHRGLSSGSNQNS